MPSPSAHQLIIDHILLGHLFGDELLLQILIYEPRKCPIVPQFFQSHV
jgi:hypothetical protein